MEFVLTLGLIAVVAAALSAGISVPILRLKKPYSKPLAVVLGVTLFVFLAVAGFVILIIESGRRGHPF
jgi:hypothetical protein